QCCRTEGKRVGQMSRRGGKRQKNSAGDSAAAGGEKQEFDLRENRVVVLGRGACQKQRRRQLEVCAEICQQIRAGSTAIAGIMAASFLQEGTQNEVPGQPLTWGQS
ncbi:3-deoxy-7-phosphoheptulonate synthase, partial [Klebsiella pneumoniae]